MLKPTLVFSSKRVQSRNTTQQSFFYGVSVEEFLDKLALTYTVGTHHMKREIEGYLAGELEFKPKDKAIRRAYHKIKRTPEQCSERDIFNLLKANQL